VAVRQQVECRLDRSPGIDQGVPGVPERAHRPLIERQRLRVPRDRPGRDHIRVAPEVRLEHRAGCEGAAVALVLGILRPADPLLEGKWHVVQRLHQLRVHAEVERVAEVRVVGAAQHHRQRLIVRHVAGTENRPDRVCQRSLAPGIERGQAAIPPRAELGIEVGAESLGVVRALLDRLVPAREHLRFERLLRLQRAQVERVLRRAEEVRVDDQNLVDHPLDDVADLGRHVGLAGKHVIAQQGQTVDGVVDVRRRGQG
jgi:hypothetical protein